MSKKYQINFIYRHTKMYVQAAPQNIGKSIISIHLSPCFHHKKKRQNICRFRKIALLIPRELEVLTDRLEVVENLFLCQRLFCTSVPIASYTALKIAGGVGWIGPSPDSLPP